MYSLFKKKSLITRFSYTGRHLCCFLLLLIILLLSAGCSFLGKRVITPTNYYILDYLPSTENPKLVQATPFNKTLEIAETKLPRTYDRNQIVSKKSYTQISYFNNELWANRLYDAVPNLLVRRLNAYRIFKNVSRDLAEATPDFILETFIQNIEYVEGTKPTAFLRMEFVLRDTKTQKIVFTNRNERAQILRDTSIEYLVQSFNEMIMFETDLFASKCIDYLSGKQVKDSFYVLQAKDSGPTDFREEAIVSEESFALHTGELLVPLLSQSEVPIPYSASYQDSEEIEDKNVVAVMGELLKLYPGKWKLSLGTDQDISTDVVVNAGMRKVIEPFWSELKVHIIDESQTKVRMRYDIYSKTSGQDAFDYKVNTRTSPSDEVGEYEYLWILKPGNYMVTVNGAIPNSYKDFTTVNLEEGKAYNLTIVVNPTGERSVLIGAGILESSDQRGRPKIHKGAIHTNISLASNNSVDEHNPTQSISLSGQFDNKIDYDIWPFHITVKSLYDLGFDKTSGTDFRVNVDDYSLKNALVFYPWKVNKFLKNFGLYGRGDFNTHLFPEYAFFSNDNNYFKVSQEQDTVFVLGEKKLKVKDALYPLRMKESGGLTYRINMGSNMTVNLRSGYGWQQDFENSVYSYVRNLTIDGVNYNYYQEVPSSDTQGFETSVLVNITNLMNVFSLTSTLDVLFPMGKDDKSTKFDNENLINIKLYRNISMDVKANIKYNKALRDYVLLDYSAFLRLSLYY